MTTVTFKENKFIAQCAYAERDEVREAGFCWDHAKKLWYSFSHGVAARLGKYADESARNEIDRLKIRITPWTAPLSFPPGEAPMEFQMAAARFALERNRCYLALDPGLGKTIIAALMIAAFEQPVIYICPPFLTRTVEEELKKWLRHLPRHVARFPDLEMGMDIFIIPDSTFAGNQSRSLKAIREFVHQNQQQGRDLTLIIDEAHRFKSETAKRTQAVFKHIVPQFKKVIFMSGTPMPNRPVELWPVLHHCAPETIHDMNFMQYAQRYCAAHKNDWGWDFSGASRLPELFASVKAKFMLRQKKSDVLFELPPKTEELVFMSTDLPPLLGELDRTLLKQHSPDDLLKYPTAVATYRRQVGVEKAPLAATYVATLLAETDESILLFAHHKEVIDILKAALHPFNPLVVTGETPMADRHLLVAEFQTNPNRRVFIGNIQAAGTGFTLTKATRVVFAEYSWVVGENDQAADRAHRIGQRDHVFVQYLVFRNSIDRKVMESLLRKRKNIAQLEQGEPRK